MTEFLKIGLEQRLKAIANTKFALPNSFPRPAATASTGADPGAQTGPF